MDEVAVAFRFGLGTIFLLSGIAKLSNLRAFGEVVRDYRVVPAMFSRAVTFAIPSIEVVLGVSLLVGIRERMAAYAVAVLLLVFSVAMAVNLARGRRISCGCLGTVSRKEISLFAITRNIALLSCALAVGFHAPDVLSMGGFGQSETDLSTSDAIALLISGTVAAFGLSLVQESTHAYNLQRATLAHLEGDR